MTVDGMRSARLRILFVSWWLPYPPQSFGGAIRTYQILRHLASRHDVTLLAYGGSDALDDAAALSALGITVRLVPPPPTLTGSKRVVQARSLLGIRSYDAGRLRSPAMQRAIDEVLAPAEHAAILVELSQMAHFRFPPGPLLIVDEQNIEFELHRRLARVEPGFTRKAFNLIEAIKIRREEPRVWKRAGMCLVTSEREEAIVRGLAPPTPTVVVSNGVDTAYFTPADPSDRDPSALVFTGRMSYRPNTDAAIFFARDVLPIIRRRRPEVMLYLVGQDPPQEVQRLAGAHVVVTGDVDDVRPYLARAAVVVAPVRAGSGTRLKILEALAMGKAIVATRLACEGLRLDRERHVLLADDAPDFADEVLRALGDPDLASALGRNGRALVERAYGWPAVLVPLDEILEALEPAEPELATAT